MLVCICFDSFSCLVSIRPALIVRYTALDTAISLLFPISATRWENHQLRARFSESNSRTCRSWGSSRYRAVLYRMHFVAVSIFRQKLQFLDNAKKNVFLVLKMSIFTTKKNLRFCKSLMNRIFVNGLNDI